MDDFVAPCHARLGGARQFTVMLSEVGYDHSATKFILFIKDGKSLIHTGRKGSSGFLRNVVRYEITTPPCGY